MAEQSTALKGGLFDNLRKMITLIDELRDVGVQDYIKLPRIAVLGTQSAGKSSLLENIVGLDFLPRGEGVVTRRPLELRLIHNPSALKPWGYFENRREEKYTDFNKVREQIIKLTDEVAGHNKGIVDREIVLTVHSADCPDLTIIDLPGITRVPLANSDQPENIEELTKQMCTRFCKDERTIILCVIPANQDISTSDGLQLSRQLDREGVRTVGVFTKIDIMDQGTDARGKLMGREIPLKLGYVGIKNRSQQDIINKTPVQEALQKEQDYFRNHPQYSSIPAEYLGTKALINKLTQILYNHIKLCLPSIMKEIDTKITECETKLQSLGPALPKDGKERMHLIWNMLNEYTETFKNQIKGKYDGRATKASDVGAGAKIKMFLMDLYEDYAKPNYQATKEYDEAYIKRSIQMYQGETIPGFPSFDSFLYLVVPQLEKLKDPSLDCLENVHVYMEDLSQEILRLVFQRFPPIQEEISEMSTKILNDQKNKAKSIIETLIDSEINYIFTNDQEYLSRKGGLVSQDPKQQDKKPNEVVVEYNVTLAKELRSRVDEYFKLVLRNLKDSIPKAIGFYLVQSAQDQMHFQLYNEIMKNENVMTSLEEPTTIALERETVKKTLEVLKKAQKVLRRDPDLQGGSNQDKKNLI